MIHDQQTVKRDGYSRKFSTSIKKGDNLGLRVLKDDLM